ncbi:MAG: polymer-forming cytoskeletal protein [archaeon]
MFGRDPIERLAIPDGTTVEEHDLVTDGDVLVGGQSTVEFGVRGQNLIAGERVHFGGDIELEGDCRLDMWCSVEGNALVGSDAYLGERVHVEGRLVVGGDLDIGDDVNIEEGFEASGWIVIRNPMPTITFFVVYLTHLLRIGEEEEAEELVEELSHDPDAPPLQIPRSARVSDETWQVSTPATIGDECRLHGNVRAHEITVGEDTNLFGSLRARDDIVVGAGTKIHGDVTSRGGDVTVEAGALVLGDVAGEDITIHQDADVDGTIRARGAMRLGRPTQRNPE